MPRTLTLIMLTLTMPLFGQSASPREERAVVAKTPKMILATNTSLVVEGRWHLVSRRSPDFSLARLNASYMTCSKTSMACEETVAELRTPGDGERLGINSGELLATCHTYEVTEWTDRVVVAISRKPAADLVVRVYLQEEKAERMFRERQDTTKLSAYTLE